MRSTPRAALLALACVCVLSVVLSGASFHDATAAPPPPGTRVAYHAGTGVLAFVGSAPGSPLARPAGLEPAAAPAAVARVFLEQLGSRFRIKDQASELSVASVQPAPNGRDVVRFQQVLDGVPVLGGELVVNLDRNGMRSPSAARRCPRPSCRSCRASPPPRHVRRRSVRSRRRAPRLCPRCAPVAPRSGSSIRESWAGRGPARPTLVWRVDVTGPGLIDELVFVDARRDTVTLHFDQVKRAKNRQVCDAGNTHRSCPAARRSAPRAARPETRTSTTRTTSPATSTTSTSAGSAATASTAPG